MHTRTAHEPGSRPHDGHVTQGYRLEMHPVAELSSGTLIELTGKQMLWDVTTDPWRELGPGTQLTVLHVHPMATSRTDREPYDLVLRTSEGTKVRLEVDDGTELVAVVVATT